MPFAWTADMARENAEDLQELTADPTFGIVTAHHGGELVGYAYGHRLPADHGWWRAFADPLPAALTAEWDARTFTLTSLAVLVPWRGVGAGRLLIEWLLRDRREERAVLSVQPAADATQAFYRHLGWLRVGRNGPLPGIIPPCWDIYVLDPIRPR